MGLDMYVYKATKPTGFKKKTTYDYDKLREKDYCMFEATDVEDAKWFADLMPFCVKINCVAKYYNMPYIAHKFNLGENAHWCGFGPDGVYFKGDNREITIPDNDINRYCIRKEKEWYVTKIKQVAYWRKHYELQDALHDAYKINGVDVENCGYYKLNDSILGIIKKMSKTKFGLGRYKTETLMYHEWY